MSNWKGKSPMDKPHNEPYTINTGIMSSQHNVAKGVWQSYFSEEKVLLLSPETSEQPTYHDALRETYPSRPKTTLAECLANEKKSLSAEYPFASRRDEQIRSPLCSSYHSPRIRMKNESLSLDKFKSTIANVKSREKREYIYCHCQSLCNSTRLVGGHYCLTEYHIKCFNEGIDCPKCIKDKK